MERGPAEPARSKPNLGPLASSAAAQQEPAPSHPFSLFLPLANKWGRLVSTDTFLPQNHVFFNGSNGRLISSSIRAIMAVINAGVQPYLTPSTPSPFSLFSLCT